MNIENPSIINTPEKIVTVRDIKNKIREKFGYDFPSPSSEKQLALWEKLNTMGARNTKTIPIESVPDIDATVELTSDEIRELEEEVNNL